MKYGLAFVLTIGFAIQAFSQNSPKVKIFLNNAWEPVPDSSRAVYYRTVEPGSDGRFLVKDHYMSGQLQMEALCTSYHPKLIWEGETKLYHENGLVAEEGPFKDEERYGMHRYWFDTGTRRKEVFFRGKDEIYHQYWSRSGQPLLRNGNGIVQEQAENLTEYYMEIEDSVMIASFNIEATDTIYMMVQKIPEYKGGYQELGRAISSAMKYPQKARRQGIEGTVYVQFIVDKKGNMKNFKVLRGISPECDEEALRAASTLQHWQPGLHKGKPVQVRFVLPIKFRLT